MRRELVEEALATVYQRMPLSSASSPAAVRAALHPAKPPVKPPALPTYLALTAPAVPGLPGFAAGGAWDTAAPSAALAAALEAASGADWRCPGAEHEEMLGLLRQWQALESWAAAGRLGVLRAVFRSVRLAAEWARETGADGEEGGGNVGVGGHAQVALDN